MSVPLLRHLLGRVLLLRTPNQETPTFSIDNSTRSLIFIISKLTTKPYKTHIDNLTIFS